MDHVVGAVPLATWVESGCAVLMWIDLMHFSPHGGGIYVPVVAKFALGTFSYGISVHCHKSRLPPLCLHA